MSNQHVVDFEYINTHMYFRGKKHTFCGLLITCIASHSIFYSLTINSPKPYSLKIQSQTAATDLRHLKAWTKANNALFKIYYHSRKIGCFTSFKPVHFHPYPKYQMMSCKMYWLNWFNCYRLDALFRFSCDKLLCSNETDSVSFKQLSSPNF